MAEHRLSRARRRLELVDGRFPVLTEVRARPSIWVLDDAVDDGERRALVDLGDRAERGELGATVVHDGTGATFEMAPDLHPVVADVIERLHRIVDIPTTGEPTLRFRRYRVVERHPPHHDRYEIGGRHLVATALVNLTDVDAGGTTDFPLAEPGASVVPRAGRLVVWCNHLDDGAPDPLALHEGAIVRRGEKTTVTLFCYGAAVDGRRDRLTRRRAEVTA